MVRLSVTSRGATPAAADTEPVPASEVASCRAAAGAEISMAARDNGAMDLEPGQLQSALSLCKPVPRILTGVILNFKPATVVVGISN